MKILWTKCVGNRIITRLFSYWMHALWRSNYIIISRRDWTHGYFNNYFWRYKYVGNRIITRLFSNWMRALWQIVLLFKGDIGVIAILIIVSEELPLNFSLLSSVQNENWVNRYFIHESLWNISSYFSLVTHLTIVVYAVVMVTDALHYSCTGVCILIVAQLEFIGPVIALNHVCNEFQINSLRKSYQRKYPI